MWDIYSRYVWEDGIREDYGGISWGGRLKGHDGGEHNKFSKKQICVEESQAMLSKPAVWRPRS